MLTGSGGLAGARRPKWDVLARIKEATGGVVTADDFVIVERRSLRGNVPSVAA